MNEKQKIVLRIGILAIVLMTIFPPVSHNVTYQVSSDTINSRSVTHYDFLLTASSKNIQYNRLLLQCFIVIIITGVLIYAYKTAKRPDTKPQTGIKKWPPRQYPIDQIIYKGENKNE